MAGARTAEAKTIAVSETNAAGGTGSGNHNFRKLWCRGPGIKSDARGGKLDIAKYQSATGHIGRKFPHMSPVATTLRESCSASGRNRGASSWDPCREPRLFNDITKEGGCF